jgi:hypothetical protein
MRRLGFSNKEIGELYDLDMGKYCLEGAKPCGQRWTSSKKGRKDSTASTSLLFGFGRGFLICNVVVFSILIAYPIPYHTVNVFNAAQPNVFSWEISQPQQN